MVAISHIQDICDVTAVPVGWTFRQPAGLTKRFAQARSLVGRTSFVESASYEPRIQAVMDRLFMTRQIEIVQYEFPQMARYRPLRPCPTVLDNHNTEHELLRRIASTRGDIGGSLFNTIEWRKVRRVERAAWSSVTLNVAASTRDADTIATADGRHVSIVPNGVDVEEFAEVRHCHRVPGRVIFVGAMRHQPNASGARWYIDHVHPRVRTAVPGATVVIVGVDPPSDLIARQDVSITVTGHVEDVRPHLRRAEVAIVPLHAGGGTRLKILEALAARVPVVSTTIGAEGIDADVGRHLTIADTVETFAESVIRLLRQDEPPPAFDAEDAFKLVKARYDWGSAIVPALETVHQEAIARFEAKGVADVQSG